MLHKIYKTLLKLSNKKIKKLKIFKDLNRHFTHDDKQIANMHKKRCSKKKRKMLKIIRIKIAMRHHYPSIKMAKILIYWQHEMLVRMWSNMNLFLVGMQNGTTALKGSLAVSYRAKHTPSTWSISYAFLGIYPNDLKSYVHKKPAYGFCSSFIQNWQNLEVTKKFFSRLNR